MRNCLCICCPSFGVFLGLVILITGVIVSFVVVPPIVERLITESVVLDNDQTEQYQRWQTSPIPFIFKIVFFNVTNVDEVQAGEIPNVEELGPYIYRQTRYKYDIERDRLAGTLSYFQQQNYEFAEDLSNGLLETDEITILHTSMNAILLDAETTNTLPVISLSLNNIFNSPTSMFLTTTVREVLFDGVPFCVDVGGIAALTCRVIGAAESSTLRPAEDGSILFSFFHHKNTTHDGRYTVMDGSENINDLARIVLWNNETRLSIWQENEIGNAPCNDISGTDSSVFSPFVSAQQIQVFNTDICRSVTIHYEKTETYEDITGRKYVNREDMLSADLKCFCDESRGDCFKNGAMDLYPCINAHVVLSLPHFLYADSEYLSGVTGLSPNVDRHETMVLLEPNSGTPLRGAKRVQFNMVLKPLQSISLTQNLRPTLMPILWIEEGIELPDDLVEMLKDALINNLRYIEIFKWSTIITGAALIIIFTLLSLSLYFFFVRPRNRKPTQTVQAQFKK